MSFSQQSFAHISHWIPYSKPAYGDDGEENEEYVIIMNADRIGVNDKVAAAATKTYNAIFLLYPAEKESEKDSYDCSDEDYHSAFEEEYAGNLLVCGS